MRRYARRERVEDLLDDLALICEDVAAASRAARTARRI